MGKTIGISDLVLINLLEHFQHYTFSIKIQKKDKTIKGFNIGNNSGEVSGQTIFHCHIHLIPRRKGDTENPRGGVRGVIPEKQKYKRK